LLGDDRAVATIQIQGARRAGHQQRGHVFVQGCHRALAQAARAVEEPRLRFLVFAEIVGGAVFAQVGRVFVFAVGAAWFRQATQIVLRPVEPAARRRAGGQLVREREDAVGSGADAAVATGAGHGLFVRLRAQRSVGRFDEALEVPAVLVGDAVVVLPQPLAGAGG
jgi:hypothetical protein